MRATRAREQDRTPVLRRQPARIVNGEPEGGYTDAYEIICRDCGDDPGDDYRDIPPRLQHIRGPYWLTAGAAQYEAHIEWHQEQQLAKARLAPAVAYPRRAARRLVTSLLGPIGGQDALQAAGPDDLFRGDQRGVDLQLNLRVLGERDVARVALV